MLKISKLSVFALLGAFAINTVYAEEKTVTKVNGVTIPQERIDLRLKIVTAQGQPDTPDLRKAIREDLINIELMSQEAIKKKLEKQSETVQQLELARQTVLVGAFVQDYVKNHPISDSAISQEYDNVKQGLGSKEYKVRHILVENESDAKSIKADLKAGKATFDKLAEKSKDAGSKEHGGDLGWVPVGNIPNTYVKEFGDALMNLSKGQISEPVKSQFGWHVIQLEDVRDLKMPGLDELKPQLTQRLQQQAVKQLISDLRDKAKLK